MKIFNRAALILLASMLGAAAPPTGTVTLAPQPGGPLDAVAAKLVADDLKQSRAGGDTLLLVGSARLAANAPPALFVQVQSASFCGSAGCSTSVYLKRGHSWRKVLDSISGPITVSPRIHHGMHDLVVHTRDRWVWTGSTYADTLPAPKIHLEPKPLR